MSHVKISAAFAAGLLLAAAGEAAEPAPLPAGFTGRHHDEAEGRPYRRPPAVRGIYGHGFSAPVHVNEDPRPDDVAHCAGTAAEQQAYAASLGSYRTEFWFYATERQGALFTRELIHPTERPCSEGLRYSYHLARAYLADGYVHSLEDIEDGEPMLVYSRPVSSHDREYSGAFNFLHNLMVRPAVPRQGTPRSRRIAGVAAACWEIRSGELCYSRASGRSRGMLLKTVAGDGERMMFDTSFSEMDDDAELDGRLFELDRSWGGPG
jgi:hypothetical protein